MNSWKYIQPGECLFVNELYKREFGESASYTGYEIYLRTYLLPDPLIYVDMSVIPYRVYRKEFSTKKGVDKPKKKWYNIFKKRG